MLRKSKATKYDYDFQNDSVFFYGGEKQYKSSIDLEGIILDFSEEHYVMGIEILNASEKFKFTKADLLNIKHLDANIEINEKNIMVTMEMKISKRNKLIDSCVNALASNSMNLPSGTQAMAVSC